MPEPQALHRNALARSGHNSRSKFPTTCSRSAPQRGTQPRTPPRRAQSNSHQLTAQPAPPSPSRRMQRGTLGSARISRAGGTRAPPPQAGPAPPRGEGALRGPPPRGAGPPPPARCPLTRVQTPAGPRGAPLPPSPPPPTPGGLRPAPPAPRLAHGGRDPAGPPRAGRSPHSPPLGRASPTGRAAAPGRAEADWVRRRSLSRRRREGRRGRWCRCPSRRLRASERAGRPALGRALGRGAALTRCGTLRWAFGMVLVVEKGWARPAALGALLSPNRVILLVPCPPPGAGLCERWV